MVLFHNFLFVFSLRLGGIIIGSVTLLKSFVWLILHFWGLECSTDFSNFLKDITENQPLFAPLAEFLNLYKDLEYYLIGLATFYGLTITTCIFLIIGSYYCKPNFIYPFLLFYILYILLHCVDMAIIFLIIRKNHNDGLETTIMYFSIAFFILAFCIYTWCCVFSLLSVIKILQRQVLQNIKSEILRQKVNIPPPRRTAFKEK